MTLDDGPLAAASHDAAGVAGDGSVEPLLDRPAGEAARRLARRQIERARLARAAFAAGEDPEALHDLRVALRRLRSLIRAFAAELRPALGRDLRRRLRRLAAATNPGRDAEVALATVELWRGEISPGPERRAAAALAEHLAARRAAAYEALDAPWLRRLDQALARLAGRLSGGRLEVAPAPPQAAPASFRARVAAELDGHRARFESALGEAASGDVDAAHRARIEAKRLRYLLEPLAGELRVATAVRRLRRLQDLLGELNDLAVLAGEMGALAAAEERRWIDHQCGLAPRPRAAAGGRRGRSALARRLAAERGERQRRLAAEWLAPGARERRGVLRELAALAAGLA